MSDNILSKVIAGKTGFVQQINQVVDALSANFLPRSLAGSVVDLAGTVGETTRRWSNGFFKVFTIKGDNSEIVFQENAVSEQIEIVNGANQIVKTTEKTFIGNTRGQQVSNDANFSNGDMLLYSQAVAHNASYSRTIISKTDAVFFVSSSSPASHSRTVTNATSIGTDLYIATSDADKIVTVTNNDDFITRTITVRSFEFH